MIADDARLVQCLQVIADKLRKHEPHIVLDVRSCSLIKSPEHSGINAVRLVFFDASSGATESATFQV